MKTLKHRTKAVRSSFLFSKDSSVVRRWLRLAENISQSCSLVIWRNQNFHQVPLTIITSPGKKSRQLVPQEQHQNLNLVLLKTVLVSLLVNQALNIKIHLHHQNNFMFPKLASQENEQSVSQQYKARMWYHIATRKRSWERSLETSRIITKLKTYLWRDRIPQRRTAT